MPFEYAVLRAVPRVDRGECVNVGVVLYCQARDYLATLLHVDEPRLRALHPRHRPGRPPRRARRRRGGVLGCPGAGPASRGSRRERFGWLTAPRSTVVQTGPVHGGLTEDPAADLARLLDRLVR